MLFPTNCPNTSVKIAQRLPFLSSLGSCNPQRLPPTFALYAYEVPMTCPFCANTFVDYILI